MEAGALVTIHALQGRPELNGKSGTVVRWVPDRGRYEVQVPGEAKYMGLRPENLTEALASSSPPGYDEATESSSSVCVLCMVRPIEMLMQPCGHVCLCRNAPACVGQRTALSECPICRVAVTGTQRVFMAGANN